jgi:argininosuccinate synthase
MPRYASLVYNGYWWSPERQALQVLIDHTQQNVTGRVVVKLFKGNVIVTSRTSENSLFDTKIATFDDDGGAYDQADAGGFIKLNALRMRIAGVKAAASRGAAKASAGSATKAGKAPAKGAATKKPAPLKQAAAKKPAAVKPAARKPAAKRTR